MSSTTTPNVVLDLDDGVVLRWLALALARVQRRRHRPAKKGRLHRV